MAIPEGSSEDKAAERASVNPTDLIASIHDEMNWRRAEVNLMEDGVPLHLYGALADFERSLVALGQTIHRVQRKQRVTAWIPNLVRGWFRSQGSINHYVIAGLDEVQEALQRVQDCIRQFYRCDQREFLQRLVRLSIQESVASLEASLAEAQTEKARLEKKVEDQEERLIRLEAALAKLQNPGDDANSADPPPYVVVK